MVKGVLNRASFFVVFSFFGLVILAALSGCSGKKEASTGPAAPSVTKIYHWKMVTSWPPRFPIFQTGAEEFAERLEKMTNGRITVQVFAGGELVPGLGVFDAVSGGAVQVGHSAAYYWAGKIPEAQFFTAVPFGFTTAQMNSWLYYGGGQELWDEIYAPHNLKPFPAGSTGVQMGGWFNRKINSIADLNGLKMRIPGLGGKVMSRAGVNVVNMPAAELYTALERGVIDATEWAGPYHDLKLGFYRAAKYYYYPGWHEPGSTLEMVVNKKAWDSLPPDLQAIFSAAVAEMHLKMLAEFDAKNGAALQELIHDHHVQLLKFPDDVLAELHKLSIQTLDELAAGNPQVKKVYDSFKAHAAKVQPWTELSEGAYHEALGL